MIAGERALAQGVQQGGPGVDHEIGQAQDR